MSSLSKSELQQKRHEEAKRKKEEREAAREALFERTKKAVRAQFGHASVYKLDNFSPMEKGYVDTRVLPCRELLLLRGAQIQALDATANGSLTDDERELLFATRRLIVHFETLLLSLNVTPRWAKYDLDIRRVTDGSVRIVARAQKGR